MRSKEFLFLSGGLGGGPCLHCVAGAFADVRLVFAACSHGCAIGISGSGVGKASRGCRCAIEIGGEGVAGGAVPLGLRRVP